MKKLKHIKISTTDAVRIQKRQQLRQQQRQQQQNES